MDQEIDHDFQMGETTDNSGLASLFGDTGTDATVDSYTFLGQTVTIPEIKIGIIVQARTTSSRFPNKVLAEYKGIPIISHVIRALIPLNLHIMVAIPDSHSNDPLANYLKEKVMCVEVYRSKWEHDVLSRFKDANQKNNFDVIIRICADCPLIKAEDVSFMLDKFMAEGRTRMVWGLGCWIFTKEMLLDVERNSIHADDREHCGFHYMSKSVDFDDDIKRLEKDG